MPDPLRLAIVGQLEPEAGKEYARLDFDLGRGYTPSVLVGHSDGSQYWRYIFKALPDRSGDSRFVLTDTEDSTSKTWAAYLDDFFTRRTDDGLAFLVTDQRTNSDVTVVFAQDELVLTLISKDLYKTEVRLREYRDVADE